MALKKVVVAGATGLVGGAALRHFGGTAGCEVIALRAESLASFTAPVTYPST